jgi:hypothetical protein
VVVAWVIVATAGLAGPAAPPTPAVPVVLKAEPAPEWSARFEGKEGWIGGDGACSAVLSPRRVLWLFGDTILGTVKEGRRTGAVMVNNTVGVQPGSDKDAAIQFVAGKAKDNKPAAVFVPASGKGWFWPQAAARARDRLFVFLAQIVRTGESGVFAFKHVGQWLAVVENPDDEPAAWKVKQHRLPFTEFGPGRERSWGSAVLADGVYLYIYGYDARGKGIGNRQLTVACVPAEKADDFGAWRFHSARGWDERPADAAPLAGGLATEFSVSQVPGGKGYVAVYTENGLGDRIVGRFADAPAGPWSAPVLLYRSPEMGKDKGVFSYAGKAHPWAASSRPVAELLLSYCVNTWEFARLFRDDTVYRPKFVRVQLGPGKLR